MTVDKTTQNGEPDETDVIPAGDAIAGRAETGPGAGIQKNYSRRRTVKGRKTRRKKKKNPGGRAANGPNAGQHIRPGIVEAAEILIAEGYLAGKVIDPNSPFDLIGYSREDTIRLIVVRPKQDVTNAAEVVRAYDAEIRTILPYWRCDSDNIQFWVFSREKGLLRYKVYAGGIRNVGMMQNGTGKPQAAKPVSQTAVINNEIRRMRDAPCPVAPTGNAKAPVQTPAHEGIPFQNQ
ncbi:MAG: hypothetical protein A4E35_01056 [Methanoregula sp. PtaU1.Bin051]|nr:MAG: hypothetical protein A4E35_01056 [Methanoregula sp. PtaU1.Bin051]